MTDADITREIINSLYAMAETACPSTLIIAPGYEPAVDPLEDEDDEGAEATPEQWIRIDPLSFPRMAARRGEYKTHCLYQFSCFSVKAEFRSDGDSLAAWSLAWTLEAALEASALLVCDYTSWTGNATTAAAEEIGYLRPFDVKALSAPEPKGSRYVGVLVTGQGHLHVT